MTAREKIAEKTYNIRIILLVVLMVFGMIITGAAIGVMTTEKPLTIENMDQVESGLSDTEVKALEKFIWEDLRVSQEFGEDKTGVVALVRPSSFVKYEGDGVRHYDMIVDVDEYRQSLKVVFALPESGGFVEAPVIECPRPELSKYAEMECVSSKTTAATVTIGRELPYYFRLETGELVTVTLRRDAGEYLNVRVSSCGDDAVKTRAKEAVMAWMRGLGYEPDGYELKVPELCDGEAG